MVATTRCAAHLPPAALHCGGRPRWKGWPHLLLPVRCAFADEVNAVVIDLGGCLCRAGYAGDDTPKAVFPAVRTAGCPADFIRRIKDAARAFVGV